MNKREFMIAYVLARAGVINANPDVSGMVECAGIAYDAIVAATPEPTDEGWIEHRGEKPYPEDSDRVTVKLRDGNEYSGVANMFVWDHLGEDDDVMAWRPARD